MAELELKHLHKDVLAIKQDVALLKNIFLNEYELTDEAKDKLAKAKKRSISEFVKL